MRPFIVCIHDAAPAWRTETVVMLRDLEPLVGRRLCFGVVPDWHGSWPLHAHPDYCALLRESAEELLLHGYHHRRHRGWGPVTLLAGSDEMNGLGIDDTRRTLARGQGVFREVFGAPARGFLAPAWQRGHVRPGRVCDIEYVLGFHSAETRSGRRVRLATATWDCGRWGVLGVVGDVIGSALRTLTCAVPVLAIHPRDYERGFRTRILRLARQLLAAGLEPTTPAALLAEDPC